MNTTDFLFFNLWKYALIFIASLFILSFGIALVIWAYEKWGVDIDEIVHKKSKALKRMIARTKAILIRRVARFPAKRRSRNKKTA